MKFEEIKNVVNAIENNTKGINFAKIIKNLIDAQYVSLENVMHVFEFEECIVINNVKISLSNYNVYVDFNRSQLAVPAIKQLRIDYDLGLREAKYINDEIKRRENIVPRPY